MKKLISLLLCMLLLLSLWGCARKDKPVDFYYLRNSNDFIYGSANGIVTQESRDASSHTADLKYLLTLYIQGPVTENLVSPFPMGCKLCSVSQVDNVVSVVLDPTFKELGGMDLTLACVCMAKTCFSITAADTVHIQVQNEQGEPVTLETITANNLLLEDAIPTEANE